MRLKSVAAASAAEAIARNREELGEDAVNISTHGATDGGKVVVTAAVEVAGPADPEADSRIGLTAALARRFRFDPLQDDNAGRPTILMGPPGGGKTMTPVELARRATLAGTGDGSALADGIRSVSAASPAQLIPPPSGMVDAGHRLKDAV